MSAFDRAAAALVADRNLGLDAVYLPASGLSVACRVVLSRPLDMMGQAITARVMVSLPVSVVALPARGDQIRIISLPRPSNTFTIEQVETDAMRAMHDLILSEA